MYVSFVTVISWCVHAFNAPSTLKRFRPLGERIITRAKHHKKPRYALKTKWAASIKKTTRCPPALRLNAARFRFFKRILDRTIGLVRNGIGFQSLEAKLFQKCAHLCRF